MVTIPVKTRLQADGILSLRVSTGLPEMDVEVVIVVQPAEARANTWPDDFFQHTYAAFADDPIEGGTIGTFDDREVFR